MSKINPLIACPSPRDIPMVQKALDSITDADKLIVKYYHKPLAMDIITRFFKDHKEYTHLAIKPDDLVSTKEHYEKLVKTLENDDNNDYPILAGLCNANMLGGATKLGICETSVPSIRRENRKFNKVDIKELPKIIEKQGSTIIKVAFAGLPFMFVRRDVLNKITLESDARFNGVDYLSYMWYRSGSYDVVFCNKLAHANIPIYVDTDVKMLHLKYTKEAENLLVGKKDPYILFQSKEGKTLNITQKYQPSITNKAPPRVLTN